jgi:hypothetical protein
MWNVSIKLLSNLETIIFCIDGKFLQPAQTKRDSYTALVGESCEKKSWEDIIKWILHK